MHRTINIKIVFFILGDSLSSEFYVQTLCSIFIGGVSTAYEDGTDRVFRNVST